MSQKSGQQESVNVAIQKLTFVDLPQRCLLLGLPLPRNGVLQFRAFGYDYLLRQADYSLISEGTGESVKTSEQILILHYLLHDLMVKPTGELISFRDFPGGQFYWEPFRKRTVLPLAGGIGFDLPKLQKNLNRFDWEPASLGDFGAKIHAIGELYLYLVYHCGDDEFPPDAEILFDTCIKPVYTTEDVVVMASRICLGLL